MWNIQFLTNKLVYNNYVYIFCYFKQLAMHNNVSDIHDDIWYIPK